MIVNIVDNRKRKYRFRKINAIIEPTWHDNCCQDSDQIERDDSDKDWFGCDEREHITLTEAIQWASELPYKLTLYLYDEDGGLLPHHDNGERLEADFPQQRD